MENIEIWKDIPNYKGYQVSNLGNVRTYNKTTYTNKHGERHWKNRILKQKWCKSTSKNTRYDARVELWKDGKHKTFLVARLVATAFLGESNLTVNHKDGNTLNNNVDNLEWCSLGDNIRKGFENDLYPQKHVLLIDKSTNEKIFFRSISAASKYIGHCSGYISYNIKRGIFENKIFKWEVIKWHN